MGRGSVPLFVEPDLFVYDAPNIFFCMFSRRQIWPVLIGGVVEVVE